MNIIGLNPAEVTAASAVPAFKLGTKGSTIHPDLGCQEFVYGRASGTVSGPGFICVELAAFTFALASTGNTAPGQAGGYGSRIAGSGAQMLNNEYGWFQVYGRGPIRTLASTAAGTRLNTTATGGAVDDDGTAGAEVIDGLTLDTASTVAATNPSGLYNYPSVSTTL